MKQSKLATESANEKALKESQNIIDTTDVDYTPLATELLEQLQTAIEEARSENENTKAAIDRLVKPVMQLKGDAPMFNYELIGTLANIMLNFLESLQTLDKHGLDIVEAHKTTLQFIVKNKMQGDGGSMGHKLVNELRDVCKRYLQK